MSESSGSEEPGDGQHGDGYLDVLSSPLDNGDELTAVLARRPRVRLPSLTVVLVAVVVASAGFIGGIVVGKHYGSSGSGLASRFGGALAAAGASPSAGAGTGARTRTGAGGGFPGAGGGFAGGGGGAGGATIGTIKLVDGSTVYVQTATGSIVQVTTSPGTKVTANSTVPVKDLQPGESVIVEGSKNSSGSVSATSISQSSAGGGVVFGG